MTELEVVSVIAGIGWVLAVFAAAGWMDARYQLREAQAERGRVKAILASTEAALTRRARELDQLDRIVQRGLEQGARAADDAGLLRDYMKGTRR